MAHRRCALYRRALLRSQQGGVPGFRAVLGIRVGADPRRKLPAKPDRQHVRTAARLREGAERAEPAAERGPAIFRSRRNRRSDASHDRDAEGLGRPRVVVDNARAEAGVTAPYNEAPTPVCAAPPTPANARARLRGSWSSNTTHSARRAAPRG